MGGDAELKDPAEKVVSLSGGPVISTGEPNADAICECEELLERLRSGDVQGFIYAQLWRDGVAGWGSAGPTACYAVIGALHAAAHAATHSRDEQ